jgi:hypothetical protein
MGSGKSKGEDVMSRASFLALLFFPFFLSGCPTHNPPTIPAEFVLDITNAKAIGIISGDAASSDIHSGRYGELLGSGSPGDEFCKITIDGSFEVIELDFSAAPKAVYNISDRFVVVVLVAEIDGGEHWYLADKTTGNAYSLDSLGDALLAYHSKYEKLMQSDSAGNLYFRAYNNSANIVSVMKIDVADPAALVANFLTPSTDDVVEFVVDGDGNVLYDFRLNNDVPRYHRLRTAGGAFTNIPVFDECYGYGYMGGATFLGFDGHLYFMKDDWSGFYRIDISESNEVSYVFYADHNNGSPAFIERLPDAAAILRIVFEGNVGSMEVHKIYGDDVASGQNTISLDVDAEFDTVLDLKATSNMLYLWGYDGSLNSQLRRFNVSSATDELVFSTALYDLMSVTISSDNQVSFSAVRLSDGVVVVASWDAVNGISVITEEEGSPEIILIPIS